MRERERERDNDREATREKDICNTSNKGRVRQGGERVCDNDRAAIREFSCLLSDSRLA